MDAAFLRRIQYKIKMFEPTRDEYYQIFSAVAQSRGLECSEEAFDYIVRMLTPFGLAYYQPRFICDHVLETCKARFSEVCRAADDERLAVRAAVGNGESTQLSRAIDTGEGDGTNGMRPCGRSDRLD